MILPAIVIAIVLGIAAQVVAERLRLPAILPLLLFGMLAGPQALGWFDPRHLGEGLEVLVHLAVAVILFEGGLSLNMKQLSRVGGAVRNLLTVGALVTTIGAAWLAHLAVGLDWPTAVLFGAIVMVTGPTVIGPLLRHMVAPRRLKTILTSEGLIIDAIGATAAYLALQWVERAGMPVALLVTEVVKVALVGVVVGFVAGSFARFATRSRIFGVEIRNLAILSILLLAYLAAEGQARQSGILTAVVMGITMSAAPLPDIGRIRMFKGQLTILLISFVFVLLAARLDLRAMVGLGGRGLAVVAGLIFVVRPLSVFLSVTPRQLPFRERLALALTAPRGIVAAAVASLSALSLSAAGMPGASRLEALVYVVILATGVWATLMALVLPRLLGYVDDPSRRRAVVMGAHGFTLALARVLKRSGRSVVALDAVPWRLERFRDAGFFTVVGDARDASSYEEAGLERDSILVAATTNDELNLLVAELAHTEFGVEHPVVALQEPPESFGTHSRAWAELLGGRGIDVGAWTRRLEEDQVELLDVPLREDEQTVLALRDAHRRWPDGVVLLCGWRGQDIAFRIDPERLTSFDSATLLVTRGEVLDLLRKHLAPRDRVGTPAAAAEGTGDETAATPAEEEALP
ncbi:MAG TPA: cation:proton antiporter [Thermoanaerobaculia bacterium]|nr:cation:proton antiporter [Thermoanaerobaculia bacterium]